MEWISTKTELPKGEALLLTSSKVIKIGDLYDRKWRIVGHWHYDGSNWKSDYAYDEITHWMPLPELPKL